MDKIENCYGALLDGIRNLSRKAAKPETIKDELSLNGVDYVNARTLAKALTELGWKPYHNGRFRAWIAPGETVISAGLSKPGNLKFLVAGHVKALLEGREELRLDELAESVQKAYPHAGVVTIANGLMDRLAQRKQWYLDKHSTPRMWRKVKDDSKPQEL